MTWLETFWKRIWCKHENAHPTETEDYWVETCRDCGHQTIEKKFS